MLIYGVFIIATVFPSFMIGNYINRIGEIRIPITNKYTIGKELFFDKKNANVDKYIVSGFSVHEGTHTWTNGNEAVMSYTLSGWNHNSDLKVEFTCGMYEEAQNVLVYANDTCISDIVINTDGMHEVVIPKDVVSTDNLTLKFILPSASSPLENGTGGDERKLGLCMRKLVILSE